MEKRRQSLALHHYFKGKGDHTLLSLKKELHSDIVSSYVNYNIMKDITISQASRALLRRTLFGKPRQPGPLARAPICCDQAVSASFEQRCSDVIGRRARWASFWYSCVRCSHEKWLGFATRLRSVHHSKSLDIDLPDVVPTLTTRDH